MKWTVESVSGKKATTGPEQRVPCEKMWRVAKDAREVAPVAHENCRPFGSGVRVWEPSTGHTLDARRKWNRNRKSKRIELRKLRRCEAASKGAGERRFVPFWSKGRKCVRCAVWLSRDGERRFDVLMIPKGLCRPTVCPKLKHEHVTTTTTTATWCWEVDVEDRRLLLCAMFGEYEMAQLLSSVA